MRMIATAGDRGAGDGLLIAGGCQVSAARPGCSGLEARRYTFQVASDVILAPGRRAGSMATPAAAGAAGQRGGGSSFRRIGWGNRPCDQLVRGGERAPVERVRFRPAGPFGESSQPRTGQAPRQKTTRSARTWGLSAELRHPAAI